MCGLFPFSIMFLVTSIAMLRERTSGTLERLMSLPLAKADLLAGYGIAFGLLAALQALVVCLVGFVLLGLHAPHGAWLIGLLAIGNAVLGMALGLFVSAFARTEFQAVQFMPAIIFPQLLLCGLFVNRHEMASALYDALKRAAADLRLRRAGTRHPPRPARRPDRARRRSDRRRDADRARARRAHSAATDCMSGAPRRPARSDGTVITGTGELSKQLGSDRAQRLVQPRVRLGAEHDRASIVALSGVDQRARRGPRSETSVSSSMSNSASSPSSISSSRIARPCVVALAARC